jgi:hypothetical protein
VVDTAVRRRPSFDPGYRETLALRRAVADALGR